MEREKKEKGRQCQFMRLKRVVTAEVSEREASHESKKNMDGKRKKKRRQNSSKVDLELKR